MGLFVVYAYLISISMLVYAQEATFVPLYLDYLEESALAVWCENIIGIHVDLPSLSIQRVHLDVLYDTKKLSLQKVLQPYKDWRVVSRESNTWLVYTQDFMTGLLDEKLYVSMVMVPNTTIDADLDTARLQLADTSRFILANGEELPIVWDAIDVWFTIVKSCNPDTQPPKVSIISPKDTTDISSDSVISFSIQDDETWIDWSSLIIDIDWLRYISWDSTVFISWDIITITPLLPLSPGKTVTLDIRVSDNETFPSANTAIFVTDLSIQQETLVCEQLWCNVPMWRPLDAKECVQLQKMYIYWDIVVKKTLDWLKQDYWWACSFDWLDDLADRYPLWDQTVSKKNQQVYLDVFSMTWWLLFLIVFFLKLYYVKQTRKYKKKLRDM